MSDDRDGPLGDIAAEIDERRDRRTADAGFDESFSEVDVGEIDGEELWAALRDEEEEETVAVPAADSAADRDVRVVPKRTCHGCPHFGEPPHIRCNHEGTEISEMVDTGRFRVVDCPMVGDGDVDELGADDRS